MATVRYAKITLPQHLKDTEYEGVKELADAAEGVLRTSGTSQEKGTVAEYPNERTVRYYLAEGLLPQPIEKRGLTSIFGYEHLLTLLAIKKLQSDGLPINVIKTLIAGKAATDLEAILGDQLNEPAPNFNFFENFRERTGVDAREAVDDSQVSFNDAFSFSRMAPPKKNAAKEYLELLLLGGQRAREAEAEPPQALFSASLPVPEPPQVPATWQRHEIEPGLELHVRGDYKAPVGYKQSRKLLEIIKKILQR